MAAIAGHLTEAELRAYREKTMPPDDRVDACAHIAGCAECLTRFSALPERRSPTAVLEAFTGFDKPWVAEAVAFADSHLSYQEMCDSANGTISGLELQRVEAHRTHCETCREDVARLGEFLKTQSPSVAGAHSSGAFIGDRERSLSRPAWTMSVGSALAGACAAGLIVYFASVRPLLLARQPTVTTSVGHESGLLTVARPTPPATAPSAPAPALPSDAAKRIADLTRKLQDAAVVKAAQDGALRKARQRQAALQAALAAATRKLKDHTTTPAPAYFSPLPIATLAKTLADGKFAALPRGVEFAMNIPSPLTITRGGGNVSLVSPVDTVTALTPRAVTFRWANTSFADRFKIVVTDVTDAKAPKVVASTGSGSDDAVTGVEWTSPTPFPRGHLFTWTVTPSRKGLALSGSTAAFRTADAATASRYARLQLALAVAQVQDKLYDPASVTLREVAADFADLPEGAKAAKLLDSLRQQRADSQLAP